MIPKGSINSILILCPKIEDIISISISKTAMIPIIDKIPGMAFDL